ncbi:MAG: SDR family NAD(P)-dependent oxidoreductase [Chthoniobacterales bacterium]
MKKIFLTGASAGIGLATARLLLAHGHQVWGTSRDLERLPRLERLHPVALDLADSRSIESAFAGALARAEAFDVVINNAGSGHFGAAEFLPAETLREQFQVLLFGQVELCQLALRAMRQQQRGLIINITSLASRLPVPFSAAYNAGKAAMVSWTMTMQLELGDSPIRMVDLQPGDICTGFNDSVRKDDAVAEGDPVRMARAWEVINRNMSAAPKPDLVAERIVRLVEEATPPPRVTVGDKFQTAVAPAIFDLLPPRLRVWGLRRYYGI